MCACMHSMMIFGLTDFEARAQYELARKPHMTPFGSITITSRVPFSAVECLAEREKTFHLHSHANAMESQKNPIKFYEIGFYRANERFSLTVTRCRVELWFNFKRPSTDWSSFRGLRSLAKLRSPILALYIVALRSLLSLLPSVRCRDFN